jgi:hypothetical protein
LGLTQEHHDVVSGLEVCCTYNLKAYTILFTPNLAKSNGLSDLKVTLERLGNLEFIVSVNSPRAIWAFPPSGVFRENLASRYSGGIFNRLGKWPLKESRGPKGPDPLAKVTDQK